MKKQCEYGTENADSVNQERCENEATEVYLGYGEDSPVHLCEKHFKEYHYADFLSKR